MGKDWEDIARAATDEIVTLEKRIETLSAERRTAVHELRAQGWSYTDIGNALGLTKARAQQLSK